MWRWEFRISLFKPFAISLSCRHVIPGSLFKLHESLVFRLQLCLEFTELVSGIPCVQSIVHLAKPSVTSWRFGFASTAEYRFTCSCWSACAGHGSSYVIGVACPLPLTRFSSTFPAGRPVVSRWTQWLCVVKPCWSFALQWYYCVFGKSFVDTECFLG